MPHCAAGAKSGGAKRLQGRGKRIDKIKVKNKTAMIKSVEVKNFKAIESARVKLGELAALVGDSGKAVNTAVLIMVNE